MSKNLVSKDNIVNILKQIRPNVISKINNKDITEKEKEALLKTSIIDTTDSGGFLSDNGKYNNIDLITLNQSTDKTNNVYELFDINKVIKKWENKTSAPKVLIYFGAQLYKDKIYCIGGYLGSDSQNYVQIYDIKTDIWTYGKPAPTTMSYHDSVISDNKIYVTGGWIRSTLNNVRVYDTESDTWSEAKPLNYARYGHVSEIYDDKIYTISGYGGNNTVEIYDIKQNIITYGAVIPTARYYFSSIIYNEKIYTGAGESTGVFEVYDIKNNKWSSLTTNKYNAADNDMVLYKDKIYFMGGSYDNKCIVIYDLKTNEWTTSDWMNNGRRSGRAIIYDKKLYCIGGSYSILPMECFQIPYVDYNIKLPDNLRNKIDCVSNIGTGDKILSDKGEYINIPKTYRFMENDEVLSVIKEIISDEEVKI